MAREYFPAYHSYLESMEELTDAERGRLFTACLLYSKTGEAPQLRGNERFVFPTFRWQIDRDQAEYAKKCAVNRKNGERGGSRWGAIGGEGHQAMPKAPQEKEKGKEEEKEEGEKTPLSPLWGRFERFWSAYPRKVGKAAARKAWEEIGPDQAMLAQMLESIEASKGCQQWQKEEGRFIPNPATWLDQGRWEDEMEPPAVQQDPYAGGETL